MLIPTYLAGLRKIKKKDEELQRKFEEVSQKIEKKIRWFPLRKALKNYTKSFGIKIVNKNDPLIQLNETISQKPVYHNQLFMPAIFYLLC